MEKRPLWIDAVFRSFNELNISKNLNVTKNYEKAIDIYFDDMVENPKLTDVSVFEGIHQHSDGLLSFSTAQYPQPDSLDHRL